MRPTTAALNSTTSPPQPDATSYQRLREHLAYLELTAASEHLAAELDRAVDNTEDSLRDVHFRDRRLERSSPACVDHGACVPDQLAARLDIHDRIGDQPGLA